MVNTIAPKVVLDCEDILNGLSRCSQCSAGEPRGGGGEFRGVCALQIKGNNSHPGDLQTRQVVSTKDSVEVLMTIGLRHILFLTASLRGDSYALSGVDACPTSATREN